MGALTLVRYLFGDLDAARTIAADRWRAIGIGLLFVCSATIAREYDGEYLPAEPIHLALPFLGGLGGAFCSGSLLYVIARLRGGKTRGYWETLTRWTACFLFMAPLAWLYAIPWERLLSEHAASVANMLVLAVVATWRVALSIRVASMLFGASQRAVSAILLGVGAPILTYGLFQQMLPLLATMGGGRLPVAVEFAAQLSSRLLLPGIGLSILMPILAIAALYDRSETWNAAELEPPAPASRGLLAIAVLALLAGVPLLVLGQAEQRLAHGWESALAAGHVEDSLEILTRHPRAEFPPQWTPLPRSRVGLQRGYVPTLLDLLDAADARTDTPRWARETWLRELASLHFGGGPEPSLSRVVARIADATREDREIFAAGAIAGSLQYGSAESLEVDPVLLERARHRLRREQSQLDAP